MRIALTAILLTLLGAGTTLGAARSAPPFRATVTVLGADQRAAMTPAVWRPGCPVHPRDLRRIRTRHWDFSGRLRTGAIDVHHSVARDVLRVLRRLYRSRVAIRRMHPIERYGGSDFRSITADNTSAFNCRFVAGTRRWSRHAHGRAIDINPRENPYVSGGRVEHPESRPFIRRRPHRQGMAVPGGAMVAAFRSVGWGWGGRWRPNPDYQHFSASGR